MKIQSLTFIRLDIPFKGVFAHGKKERSYSDTILVKIATAAGNKGWGEILARSYVTGETNTGIMASACAAAAENIIGQSFANDADLYQWVLAALPDVDTGLALFGGIELALWDAMRYEQSVNFEQLLGARRTRKPEKCITIGFDASRDDMRGRVIDARMKRASVVKLKVGQGIDTDVARLQSLNQQANGALRIRLDGNRTFTLAQASQLLSEARNIPVESFEEPLNCQGDELRAASKELNRLSGVDIMADESVCSMNSAVQNLRSGAFQAVNIRLGKNGGLVGSKLIRDFAVAQGVSIVAGSMVGESGVLTGASERFLEHSDVIPYVEGLGQNKHWLRVDPVLKNVDAGGREYLSFNNKQCESLVTNTLTFS